MARPIFFKVRPYVAERLGVMGNRPKMPDGNYLLYQCDLLHFGPLFRVREYAAAIGAAMLDDEQAASNCKEGGMCTPMPEPTDPEWAIPEGPEPEAGQDDEAGEGGQE